MRPAALVLLIVGTIEPGSAQPVPLRVERLGVERGFSGLVVEAVVRDGAGFLWSGGQHGLERYDGVRVHPLTVGGARVLALAQDPARPGALWVASDGGVVRVEAHTLRRTAFRSSAGGALDGAARALLADADGVWVGTAGGGLVRLAPGARRFATLHPGGRRGMRADSVRALLAPRAAPGVLWVGTAGGLARLDLATHTFRAPAETALAADRGPAVTALAESGGALWCATADGVLHRLDPATGARTGRWEAGHRIAALAASPDDPGALWVGTRGAGLLRFDAGAFAPTGMAGESDVLALHADAAGLLWAGTTSGVYRADLRPPRFAPTPVGPGAAGRPSLPVFALHAAPSAPGVLWLGLRDGLRPLDRATGALGPSPARPGALPGPLFALHEDARGRLWVGGADDPALFLLDRATGNVRRFPLAPGRDHVYALYEAPSRPGLLWAGTDDAGLIAFDAEAQRVWRRFPTPAPRGRGEATVWAVAEAPEEPGVLWVATHGAGLQRLDLARGTLERAPTRDGCTPGDTLRALAPGPGGVLWVGAARYGLLRYDRRTGACRRLPPDDGLPTDASALFLDAGGRVWMSTQAGGLVLYDPAREVFTRFTEADGLLSREFYIPARQRTPAGELLFGGSGGALAFRPEGVRVDTAGPPVAVTRLLVDGEPAAPARWGRGRPLALAHDRNDLAFEFAALDLRDPAKTRYRARLRGADTTWLPLGSRAEVRYPVLAPGRYTFEVAGTNADGYWSPAPAAVAFVIRPPYWRTWWFWSLVGALVLGVVVAGYQYRIRQMLRVEHTRRRIADDLHDDIGSKVSAVALRLDLAGRSAALPEAERRRLAELAGAARGVVSDLRDAVWFVDAGHDDLPALVARMEQATAQMLDGRPYAFRRPAAIPPVPLGMEPRRHLFLLFREALHNAVKHAGGCPVEVRVSYAAGRLTLTVADGGPGFDPAAVGRGRGQATMRQRAEALGGTLRVESAPGRGTTVVFEVELM